MPPLNRVALLLTCVLPCAALAQEGGGTPPVQGEGVMVQTMCTNCNNADFRLGGLGAEHVAVRCDGRAVPSGLEQVYLLTICPGELLDRVAVERGVPGPAYPGWAVGGLLDIGRMGVTSTPALALDLDAGSFDARGAGLRAWGRRGRSRGFAAATWSTASPVDPNDDGNPNQAGFERVTIDARGEFEVARGRRFSLGGMYYREDQEQGRANFNWSASVPDGVRWEKVVYNTEDLRLERYQVDAACDVRTARGDRVSVALVVSDRAQVTDEGFPLPTYDIDERRSAARASWARSIGVGSTLRAGVDAEETRYGVIDLRYNVGKGLPFDLAQHETTRSGAAWAELEVPLGTRSTLSLGMRWQSYAYRDEETRAAWLAFDLPEGERWLPRATLLFKPSPAWTVRASAGSGFRQPAPTYDEVCCGRRYRGNRGIDLERSAAYAVEAAWQPNERDRVAVALSLADFDDFVLKTAAFSLAQQATWQNVNLPRARVSSAVLEARTRIARGVSLRGSFTLLAARNRTEGAAIPELVDWFDEPRVITYTLDDIPFVPSRTAAAGIEARFGGGVVASLDGLHTGPLWTQSFNALVFDPVRSVDTLTWQRTPSFWVVNARLDLPLRPYLVVSVAAENLLDTLQANLDDGFTEHTWGPLQGRSVRVGLRLRMPAGRERP